jgi:hypothetical protein
MQSLARGTLFRCCSVSAQRRTLEIPRIETQRSLAIVYGLLEPLAATVNSSPPCQRMIVAGTKLKRLFETFQACIETVHQEQLKALPNQNPTRQKLSANMRANASEQRVELLVFHEAFRQIALHCARSGTRINHCIQTHAQATRERGVITV